MHKTILTLAFAACSVPLLLVAQNGNVTLPQDKGPDKINVSTYPPAQQKAYSLFVSKCSACHTIARPINTTMTQGEWERYVKRMMHKPTPQRLEKLLYCCWARSLSISSSPRDL